MFTVDDKLKGELCASEMVDSDTDILAFVRPSQVVQRQTRSLQVFGESTDADARPQSPVYLHVITATQSRFIINHQQLTAAYFRHLSYGFVVSLIMFSPYS